MSDAEVTIREAAEKVREFCEERDWDAFHGPKDLAIGIVTEASELLDLFRFKSDEECRAILEDGTGSERVREELADVLYFVLRFGQMNGIDLSDALDEKLAKNGVKYPVDKSRGRNLKYDELRARIGFIRPHPSAIMESGCRRGTAVKLDDLLYSIRYDDYDYAAGERYFTENPPSGFSCSAVSKGRLMGRNYDWAIGDKVDFVIFVPAAPGRHASMGVSSSLIPSGVVDSGAESELYEYVPFMTMDGVNDAGLACCVNGITVSDRGKTESTNPGAERLSMAMVVRTVLDHASSVNEAVDILRARDVHSLPKGHMRGFEMHYMVADRNGSAVIEFVDGKICVTYGVRILSNFHMSGARNLADLDRHSHGIERYRILSKGYKDVGDRDGMLDLMRQAWYSKTYDRSTDPFWYSEYYNDYTAKGDGDFGLGDEPQDWMVERIEKVLSRFEGKDVVDMWHTGHCSVYDVEEKTLDLIPNETGRRHFFKLSDIPSMQEDRAAWARQWSRTGWSSP